MSDYLQSMIENPNQIDDAVFESPDYLNFQEKIGEIKPQSRGFGGEYRKALKAGGRNFLEEAVSTASALTGSETLDRMRLENEGASRVRGEEQVAEGAGAKIAYLLGLGTVEIPLIVGSQFLGGSVGAVGAKIAGLSKVASAGQKLSAAQKFIRFGTNAGMFMNIAIRGYGDNYYQLERDGATPKMAHLGALTRTFVTYALERYAGPERFISKNVENNVMKWALGAVDKADDGIVKSTLISNYLKYPRSFSRRVGQGMAEETLFEEIPDLVFKAITDIAINGSTDVDSQDFIDTLISTPIQTLPMALLGGFSGVAEQQKVERRTKELKQPPTTEAKKLFTLEELANVELMAEDVARRVAPVIGEEGAQAVASLMYNISVNLAANTDPNTEVRRPEKFLELFSVAVAQGNINQSALREAVNQGEDALLAYVSEAVPELETQLIENSDKIDVAQLETDNKALEYENKSKSQYYNVDQKELKEPVAEVLQNIEIDENEGAVLLGYEVKEKFGYGMFKALFAHERMSGINVDGKNYRIQMLSDGSMVIRPQTDAEAEVEEAKWSRKTFAKQKQTALKKHSARIDQAEGIWTALDLNLAVEENEQRAKIQAEYRREANVQALSQAVQDIEQGVQVPTEDKVRIIFEALKNKNPNLTNEQLDTIETELWAMSDEKWTIPQEDGTIEDRLSPLEELIVNGDLSNAEAMIEQGKAIAQEAADEAEFKREEQMKADIASLQEARERAKEVDEAVMQAEDEEAKSKKEEQIIKEQLEKLIKTREESQKKKREELESKVERSKATPIIRRQNRKRVLKSENSEDLTVLGTYLPRKHLAIFYENATAQDVMHEWIHHIVTQELLPSQLDYVLRKQYSRDGIWDDEAHERVVDAFMQFISDGRVPVDIDVKALEALAYMRKIMRGTYEEHQDLLNDKTLNAFASFFGKARPNSEQRAIGLTLAQIAEMALGVNTSSILLSEAKVPFDESSKNVLKQVEDKIAKARLDKRVSDEEVTRLEDARMDLQAMLDSGRNFAHQNKQRIMQRLAQFGLQDELQEEFYPKEIIKPLLPPQQGILLSEGKIDSENDPQLAEQQDALKVLNTSEERTKAMRHLIYKRKIMSHDALSQYARDLGYDNVSEMKEDELQELLNSSGVVSRADAVAVRIWGTTDVPRAQQMELARLVNILKKSEREAELTAEEKLENRRKEQSIDADAKTIQEDLDKRPDDIMSRSIAVGGSDVMSQMINTTKGIANEASNWIKALGKGVLLDFTGWEALLNRVSDGDPNSALVRTLGGVWNKMQHNLASQVDRQRLWLAKADEKYGRIPQNLGRFIQLNGRNFTANDALGIYLITRGKLAQDKNGEFIRHESEALFQSNPEVGQNIETGKLDRDTFIKVARDAEAFVKANQDIMNLVHRIDDFYNWIYDDLNKVKRKLTKEKLGRIKDYFPMIREGGLFLEDDWLAKVMDISPEKSEKRLGTQGSLMSRGENPRAKRINLNVTSVFESYRAQALTYIAKAEGIDYMQRLMNKEAVASTLERKGFGKELDSIRTLIERERYHSGRMQNWTDQELIIKAMSSRFKLSALAGNAASIMRQAISGFNGAAELPFFDGLKIGYNMVSLTNYALLNIAKPGEALDGNPIWEKMKRGDSVHTQSKHDPAEADILNAQGRIMNTRIAGLPIKEFLVLPQRIVDQVTRTSVWGAAYDFKMKQLKNKGGLSNSEMEAKAFRFAEDTVSRTQPAANISERNLAQTGSEFLRAMILFTGQHMKNFDYFRTQMATPLKLAFNKGLANGGSAQALAEVGKIMFTMNKDTLAEYGMNTNIAHKFAMSFVAPSIALGLIAKGRPPKDWNEFVKDIIAYNIMMIPIFGPLIALKMLNAGWDTQASPLYMEVINAIGDAAGHVLKALEESDPEEAKKIGGDLLEMSKFIGLPNKIIQNIRDANKGYYEAYNPDIADYIKRGVFRLDLEDPGTLDTLKKWRLTKYKSEN